MSVKNQWNCYVISWKFESQLTFPSLTTLGWRFTLEAQCAKMLNCFMLSWNRWTIQNPTSRKNKSLWYQCSTTIEVIFVAETFNLVADRRHVWEFPNLCNTKFYNLLSQSELANLLTGSPLMMWLSRTGGMSIFLICSHACSLFVPNVFLHSPSDPSVIQEYTSANTWNHLMLEKPW